MLKITRVSLKNRETLSVDHEKTEDPGNYKIDYETPVHPDLVQAVDNLRIHYGILSGDIPVNAIDGEEDEIPEELVRDLYVSGFTVSSDFSWVILTGYRKLWDGKARNSNTPRRPFEEGEKSRYLHIEDLKSRVERVISEVRKYIDGSKRGKEKQGKLDFPAPASTDKVTKLKIAEPDSIATKAIAQAKEKLDRENIQKVTPETLLTKGVPKADPEAMARIAEADQPKNGSKVKAGKKGRQTPDNPGGE